MDMVQILERVIDEGIVAAKADRLNSLEHNHACLEGSLAGFEACRGKDAAGLKEVLTRACKATNEAFKEEVSGMRDKYWYSRCFKDKVDFVCSVISVLLMVQGLPPITNYTADGVKMANKILMSEGCYVPLVGTEKEFLDFSA